MTIKICGVPFEIIDKEVIICRKENNGTDDRWDRIIILNTEKVIV